MTYRRRDQEKGEVRSTRDKGKSGFPGDWKPAEIPHMIKNTVDFR